MTQEPLDSGSGQDDLEFNWDEYLEEEGATAVPHHAFKHVDLSSQTGFSPGMQLEVRVKGEPEGFWVATIITTCGQLLLLRHESYHDDRRADFWCDVMTAELHPIGWSRLHGKELRPPEGIREKHENLDALVEKSLSEGCSAPASLLEGPHRGKNLLDLLAPGLSVELQDHEDTRWAKEHGCTLSPPVALRSLRSEAEWDEVRRRIMSQMQDGIITVELLKDQRVSCAHSFTEGMKLEAVDPFAPFCISPATVTKDPI
ncbi:hypothetical protein GJAV_G00173890 [Gymnothorax javanicus]|nr:hypothetical protein GJAV_G00173890 [Gymnothorax javanicus]